MPDLALGLMSGTSCDGISAALVQFKGQTVKVVAERTTPYPKHLARTLRQGTLLTAAEISALNVTLGELFAKAALQLLKNARTPAGKITVIGSHGHTLYHGPHNTVPSTLQIAEAAVIAERTGIPVIANFRARDIAAGGEGAPLVPAFDEVFFGGGAVRALQNIGGIANVTFVGRAITTQAFDTGPGNCLIDLVTSLATRGKQAFDANGHLALRGRIDHRAVKRLWRHPYFRKLPPKSTGRELFNEQLLRQQFGSQLKRCPVDVLATVTYFTAFSIVESYRRFFKPRIREVIVSGGGTRNRTFMRHLTRLLTPVPVHAIERYNIPSQAKEPAAFAWLALRAFKKQINHLPDTTGAKAARILGSLAFGNPHA